MKKQSDDEREHAMGLMKFQNTRGGRIVLRDIKSFLEEISTFSSFAFLQYSWGCLTVMIRPT
ncbi:unnamed protein product [Gongylonema pulchrum]|uniref:Ferritin-like diiron domain-containing protein n=1 Tax=Gongylonema pulchrum TaxID=637853 RepID=A0A3P7NPC1_9BILA|nr:unnamed protein product [Gongylonema pulchrum]